MSDPGGLVVIFPNAPLVVSETVDGEAIIMHHGSGHYFDTSASGAVLWQAIEGGATRAGLVLRLTTAFEVDGDAATAAVDEFVATLSAHDLIREAPGTGATRLEPVGLRQAFAAPVLGVHADLADMLLLDPIHDVDESGWPAARPQPRTA